MRKGALKKKEKIVKGEMDRFSHSLAQLNAMGVAAASAEMQVEAKSDDTDAQAQTQTPTTSTASRWAALRGFISSTMEQNPAFVGTQNTK
ncbi:hypothetical protein ONZ43_g6941 [Nemania bipapillata]|uniref:Uncharacterized protein n=1 Tax=Nemania bipapillata TaxID=110536 RepID=A0ACC2HUM5_9PEZI|nr:hypothetical protein ONZ43_g6941 [Nemania bipapillata]